MQRLTKGPAVEGKGQGGVYGGKGDHARLRVEVRRKHSCWRGSGLQRWKRLVIHFSKARGQIFLSHGGMKTLFILNSADFVFQLTT